ncbi:Uncharacterized protein PCOAH_00014330 [Plasmodium coatneyi]|uniref:Uncharacterized protein n=1 Tax=Plasmodium coatneyi TaxID=208452 RepID=A0A1B1DW04_9APIC|nr:Uncharacterized protein PCOAH_00014330 [Plasmodium coatneyi]ANQ06948.1 Uncharacterized protein PCOAH_00014330 [Plasmodium coatneyi]
MQNKSNCEKNVPLEELHFGGVHGEMYTPQVEFPPNQLGGDSEDGSSNRARTNRVDALQMIKTNEVSLFESQNDTMSNKLKNLHILGDHAGVGVTEMDRPNSIEVTQDRIVNPYPAGGIHSNILNLYNGEYRTGELPSGVTSLQMLEGEAHAEDTLVLNKRDEPINQLDSWGDYNFFNSGMPHQGHIETAFCLGKGDTNFFARVTGRDTPPGEYPMRDVPSMGIPNRGEETTLNNIHKRECSFDTWERSPPDEFDIWGYHYIGGGGTHVKSPLLNERTHYYNVKFGGEDEDDMGTVPKGGCFSTLTNKCDRCSSGGALQGDCSEEGREKLLSLNHLSSYEDNPMFYEEREETQMGLNLGRVPAGPIECPTETVQYHKGEEQPDDTILLNTVNYLHGGDKNPCYEYAPVGGNYKGEPFILQSHVSEMASTDGASKNTFDFPLVEGIHMNDTNLLKRKQESVKMRLKGDLHEEGHGDDSLRIRTSGFPNERLNRLCIGNQLDSRLDGGEVSTGEKTFCRIKTDRGRNEYPRGENKRLNQRGEDKLGLQICDLLGCTPRISALYGGDEETGGEDPKGENPQRMVDHFPFIRGTKKEDRLPHADTYQLNEFLIVDPPYFIGNKLINPTEKNPRKLIRCEDMHWGESTSGRDTHNAQTKRINENQLIRVENMFEEDTVDVVRSSEGVAAPKLMLGDHKGGDTHNRGELNRLTSNRSEEHIMTPPFATNHVLKTHIFRDGMLYDPNEEATVGKRSTFPPVVTSVVPNREGCLASLVSSNTKQFQCKSPDLSIDQKISTTHIGRDASGGNRMEKVPYKESGRCTEEEERGMFKDPFLYTTRGENPWAFQQKEDIFTNNRTEMNKSQLTYTQRLFASPYRHEEKGTLQNATLGNARTGDDERKESHSDGTVSPSPGDKPWGNNPLTLSLPISKADKGLHTTCNNIIMERAIPRATYARRTTNVGESRNALKDSNVNLLKCFRMNFERGRSSTVGSARLGVGDYTRMRSIGRVSNRRTPLRGDFALRPTDGDVTQKSNLFESVDAFFYNFKKSGGSSGGEYDQVEGHTVGGNAPACSSVKTTTTNTNCTQGWTTLKGEDNHHACLHEKEANKEDQHSPLHFPNVEEEKLPKEEFPPLYEKDGADAEKEEKTILTIQWNIKKISLLCSSDNYFVVSPEYKTETLINEFFILLNINQDVQILVENSFDLLFSYTGFCDILFSVTCGKYQKKFCFYDFSTIPWFGFNKWGILKNCMENDSISITVDIHDIRRKDSLRDVFLTNVIASMRSNNGSFHFKEGTPTSSSATVVEEKKPSSSSMIGTPSATGVTSSSSLDAGRHKCFFPHSTPKMSDSYNKLVNPNFKRRHTGSMHTASTRQNTIQWQNRQTSVNNYNGKITNQQNHKTNRETNTTPTVTQTHGNKLYKVTKKNVNTEKTIEVCSPFERNHGGNSVQPQGCQEGTLPKGTPGSGANGCANQPIAQLECPPQMKKKENPFRKDPPQDASQNKELPTREGKSVQGGG